MTDEKNLLGMIGMCRGAGKAIIGVPMICEQLRKRKSKASADGEVDFMIIEASDTSDNTHKKLTDKCIYYNVMHVRINSTCEALGRAVGKSAVGAVALADKNFCRAVLGKLQKN